MDVADKFKKIWILLAQDGFVAVLKQMPGAVMATVEVNRIACQQPPHDDRYRYASCPNKQMKMVGNEHAQAKQLVEVSDNTAASRSTK